MKLEERVDGSLTKYVAKEVALGVTTGGLPGSYLEEKLGEKKALTRCKTHIGAEYIAAAGALALTPVLGIPAAVVGGAVALDAIVRSAYVAKKKKAIGSGYIAGVWSAIKGVYHGVKETVKGVVIGTLPEEVKEVIGRKTRYRINTYKYTKISIGAEALAGSALLYAGFATAAPVMAGIGGYLVLESLYRQLIRYDSYNRKEPGSMVTVVPYAATMIVAGLGMLAYQGSRYLAEKTVDGFRAVKKRVSETPNHLKELKDGYVADVKSAAKEELEKDIELQADAGRLSIADTSGEKHALSLADSSELSILED